jgi:hypothetical protein
MRRWQGTIVVVLAVAGVCWCVRSKAQQPPQQRAQTVAPAPLPTGSVTGTVVAEDTQRPVRFAQVSLQSVASASPQPGDDNARGFGRGGGGSVQTRTEVDGTFLAENVAPGDYYVTAGGPGFIPLHAQLQAQVAAGADPARLLAAIPVVHVSPGAPSTINISLQRGGTISGRVLWEDGSPASGLSLAVLLNTPTPGIATTAAGSLGSGNGNNGTALPAVLQGIQSPSGNTVAQTDDRGAFRLSGLATGDYLLRAVIQPAVQFGGGQFGGGGRGPRASPIVLWSPGVFRRSAAKTVSVRAGEERSDVRVVIDLRSLRTVSGHASSATAGVNVASGRVNLTDASDASLQLQGSIDPHGDFSLRYVPPGNYTLQVTGASNQANNQPRGRGDTSTTPAVTFQRSSQPVVVLDTDLSGVAVSLTPVQTTP